MINRNTFIKHMSPWSPVMWLNQYLPAAPGNQCRRITAGVGAGGYMHWESNDESH